MTFSERQAMTKSRQMQLVASWLDYVYKKKQIGKDQEKAQSEKDSHSKNRGGKKLNQKLGTYTKKTYRMANEQLFSQ